MGLILRSSSLANSGNSISIKGSALAYNEGDGNFMYLLTNMSGSNISITGSTGIAGNTSIAGNLTVTGNTFITASWATNALTASYITSSNVFGPNGANSILSASYALSSSQSTSSSYSTTASYVLSGLFPYNGAAVITGSLLVSGSGITITGSLNANNITGSLFGTASWATSASMAISSSYSFTSSYYVETDPIFVDKSASLATTGSNVFNGNQIISGSFTVFTGSGVELQVLNTGIKIGNATSDIHIVTGSLRLSGSAIMSGSINISGSLTLNGISLGKAYSVYTALFNYASPIITLTQLDNTFTGTTFTAAVNGTTIEITASPSNTFISGKTWHSNITYIDDNIPYFAIGSRFSTSKVIYSFYKYDGTAELPPLNNCPIEIRVYS